MLMGMGDVGSQRALMFRCPICHIQLLLPVDDTGLPRVAFRMSKSVVEVQVRAVVPTTGGCAVFVGNEEKIFVIYVDQSVGQAITMFMRGAQKERPLTHDLLANVLMALGARIDRIVINELKRGTYFARMILSAENELHQRKVVEIDARPSDCIAMAAQQKAAIYVSREVWEEVDDMADVLRKMEEEGSSPGESEEEF